MKFHSWPQIDDYYILKINSFHQCLSCSRVILHLQNIWQSQFVPLGYCHFSMYLNCRTWLLWLWGKHSKILFNKNNKMLGFQMSCRSLIIWVKVKLEPMVGRGNWFHLTSTWTPRHIGTCLPPASSTHPDTQTPRHSPNTHTHTTQIKVNTF